MNELKSVVYNHYGVSSTKELKETLARLGVEVHRYDFRRKSDWQMLCKKFGIKVAAKKKAAKKPKSSKQIVEAAENSLKATLAENKVLIAELTEFASRLERFGHTVQGRYTLPPAVAPIALLAPAAAPIALLAPAA